MNIPLSVLVDAYEALNMVKERKSSEGPLTEAQWNQVMEACVELRGYVKQMLRRELVEVTQ